MLKSLQQNLFNPTCLSCGSFFVERHLFCVFCYQSKIEKRLDLKKIELQSVPEQKIYSIFEWRPGESDVLSEVVYRLKNTRCPGALEFYTGLALQALKFEEPTATYDFVVPIPGSSKRSTHAFDFAVRAAQMFQIPMANLLHKEPSVDREQKALSKQERSQIQISLREQITEGPTSAFEKSSRILMVDDIITTGNTFFQSVNALGTPNSVTLLTLFHRPLKSQSSLVS